MKKIEKIGISNFQIWDDIEIGFKIYQIRVRLIHYESRDNKRIRAQDQNKLKAEMRNLETLQNIWKDSELYKTLDEKIND